MSKRTGARTSRRGLLRFGAVLAAAPMLQATLAFRAAAQTPPDPRPFRPSPPFADHQIDQVAKALTDAESHGFKRGEFVPPDLADLIKAQDLRGAEGQAMLRTAVLDYARAQRGQRVQLDQFLLEWSVRPAPYDPAPELDAAILADRIGPWLDSLPPRYEGYQALRRGLARYRALKGWKTIPDGGPLSVGVSDPRVVALRRRLAAEDPALPGPDGDDATFDATLAAAVQKAQRRLGLYADGIAGPPTLGALNQPLGQRVLQIEANMERWRWLPRQLPDTRLQVNIAAAVLAAYRDGQPVMAMKAVAGRPEDQTPMLASEIHSIVLNPPWHVPDSIARKELWPKAQRDKHYLARNQFVVQGGRLIQKAGPKSALGRFKFDFPNSFGVYLHDTPAQAGFSRTSRLASHGCVRLEQPKALASLLLQDDSQWPETRISDVVATTDTTRIPLPEPVPVYILYWTAFMDNADQMQFRADAYDWDRKLSTLLTASNSRNS